MENFLELLREKKLLCACLFLGALGSLFFVLYLTEVTAEEKFTCPKIETLEDFASLQTTEVAVDVKGAVVNPGVYRVKKDAIVADLITLAGGLLDNADTSNLNLSKVVTNEMVITVFTKEEVAKQEEEKVPILDFNSEKTESKTKLVNLNTATLEELMTLPGIGEQKANIILQYRDTCGDFLKKEELKNIKGIGEAIYVKLEKYITV